MNFQTEKLGGHMAAAVSGLDLNRLPDSATQAVLVGVLHDNLVLCIRGQKLAPPAFRDAMAQFGVPMLRKQLERTPECAEVNIISSEDRDTLGDGRKIVNGANWHTDDSFMRAPCSLTMLYGVAVPSRGGDTQFTNMYAAYEDLPAEMKRRIDSLRAVHKYSSSRKLTHVSTRPAAEMAAMPEATHPLVRTHPETHRKSLYLNPNRIEHIVGLERAESDRLLDELIAHATQPKY
jgi:taurine dioxygenase